ncbi:ATP/GTP-binding protein [Pseudomonas sp. HS6]|uniref:AAA family ATPase n=1 Tax=Pseudomonas sp. HS6 TaxID=2850559 RepID=UPI002018972C|nr:ATP-binding protein [Pseudomonas sp. HS6]UQS13667.1 ATP-binding protein [Pseudomonas sp. HS6]
MIIDLTIKNFRSFKDEQLFSMNVENPKSHLLQNIATTESERVNILKTVGIYGANASGKSNLLLAFLALQWITDDSGSLKEGESIPCYEPYLLSDEAKSSPVCFEIEFINHDDIRYIYSVTYNRTEVLSESLDFFPSRQKANIFKRALGDTWETISFGSHYKGGQKRMPFFKNNSYLAKAGNNAAASELIRSVYNYLRSIFYMGFSQKLNVSTLYDEPETLNKVSKLLSCLDTGITGITRKENNVNELLSKVPSEIPNEIRENIIKRHKYNFKFSHAKEDSGVAILDMSDESDGTQKLFEFLPLLLTVFEIGSVLIMDELDNSFHPHIGELIIKLFNDPEVNRHNAQLIFTTHDINLMSPQLMRRDQIWFTEKTSGASTLYSLDEFDKSSVKSSSPYGHWYDEGRFGALPNISYSNISRIFTGKKKSVSQRKNKNKETVEISKDA